MSSSSEHEGGKPSAGIKLIVGLAAVLGLSGCPQSPHFSDVIFVNRCDHPVRVTTTHSTNIIGVGDSLRDRSAIGAASKSESIAQYILYGDDIHNAVSEGITLTIDGDGGSITLGRADVLTMLDRGDKPWTGRHATKRKVSYEPICKHPPQ